MSGAETITALSLISSVITIFQTSRYLYDAATGAKGLPAAFHEVSLKVSLVLNILHNCRKIQQKADQEYASSTDADRKRDLEKSAETMKPVMIACQENAEQLRKIFQEVIPAKNANLIDRYRKVLQSARPSKKKKVEDLMKAILEELQLLQTDRFFKNEIEKRSEEINDAIQQLSELPSSLDPEEASHSGRGVNNINSGGGTQRNNFINGGHNVRQFNVEKVERQIFARDEES